jgi:hypothetical protein
VATGALTRIQQLKQRLSRLSAGQQDSSPLRRDSIELQLRAAEERLLRLRLTAESNQQVLQVGLGSSLCGFCAEQFSVSHMEALVRNNAVCEIGLVSVMTSGGTERVAEGHGGGESAARRHRIATAKGHFGGRAVI